MRNSIAADVMLSIYLCLMINSKTTELRLEKAPPKLNAARVKTGKAPLHDHSVVSIVPVRYIRDSEGEAKAMRRSPRLHWRRSHLRRIDHQTPKAKQLSNGQWGILITRFLVGAADKGAISHEYRVGNAG
jgi:hypothetical protein